MKRIGVSQIEPIGSDSRRSMIPVCYGELSHLMFQTRDWPISEKLIKPESNLRVARRRFFSLSIQLGIAEIET